MSTANSNQNCTPTKQEVKASVTITCPQTGNINSYLRRLGESYNYVESVYNEVQGISLTNGTLREKWNTSSDPRYQEYDSSTGQPIYENYCRMDKGVDEGYFYHLWQYPATHSSVKDIIVKYQPVCLDLNGDPTLNCTGTTNQSLNSGGSCVRKAKITNNFTLDRVDISVSGLPTVEDHWVYSAATTDPALIFTYKTDTRTVIKAGDVLNGHTVTEVANFCDTRTEQKRIHRVVGDSAFILNNVKNIQVGDVVRGYIGDEGQFPTGLTVKSIDTSNNKIKLNLPSGFLGFNRTKRKKLRNVTITAAEPNAIPSTNYCYAKLASNVTLGNRQLCFRLEGPGIHDNDWKCNTNIGGDWTGVKVFNEGGNAIFNSTTQRQWDITRGDAVITMIAEPINDGGEFDSNWYIAAVKDKAGNVTTSGLPPVGTTFQSTQNGGRGNIVIKFKVIGTADQVTTTGSDFNKDGEYTGSLSGATIVARAGWGIKDRAAMVGIIVSKRKDILYEPVFQKEGNIVGDELNDLTQNFPGISTLNDIRSSEYRPIVVDSPCDPYLTPNTDIPLNVGNADNSTRQYSDNNATISAKINEKVDELAGTASVTDIADAIQTITIAETTVNTDNNDLSDDAQSNIDQIRGKTGGDNAEVELTTKQDTSVNTLITNILSKFSEVPQDMNTLVPEHVPDTANKIDGENIGEVELRKNAYRDLPVKQDGIYFLVEDLSLEDRSYENIGKNANRDTIVATLLPRWLFGTPTVGTEVAGETEIKISGTTLGGASPANDLNILVVGVNDSTGAITEYELDSAAIPKLGYSNITPNSLQTQVNRTTFNVTSASGGYTATINTSAGNAAYKIGQQLRITGSSLGGTAGTDTNDQNDCFITVTGLSGNEISTFDVTGSSTGSATFTNVSPLIVLPEFSIGVAWQSTESINDDIYTVAIDDEKAGQGYLVGDELRINGGQLGGANTVHDIDITVTAVDFVGGLQEYTFTGTPETLYTGVSGSNTDGKNGSGATFDILKGTKSDGTGQYIVNVANAGQNYNTVTQPTAMTVSVDSARRGRMEVNNGNLNDYPTNFTITFSSNAPSPLSNGTAYGCVKASSDKFFVYYPLIVNGIQIPITQSGRYQFMAARVRFSSSPQNIGTFSFGLNQVQQTVNFYSGSGLTNYVESIDLSAPGEVYPDKSWKGADYEYRSTYYKEYEFDMVSLSGNIARGSFNKGNPLQLESITSKLTSELKPTDSVIKVENTDKFLSSGYLMIPKWIRKTEIYVDLGTGENQTQNERNHYFYDGEEIVFYGSKTNTEFRDLQRSQFNSDALFTTSMEPYAKSGGVVNSYQKGYSVQQYWPYQAGG